jgi:hypothetical protein
MDTVNVDTHFASLYTIFDPINPQGREFFLFKDLKQETPMDLIVRFFKVKLEYHPFSFAHPQLMQDFMKNNYPLQNEPPQE